MNNYSVAMTLNPITGDQSTTAITAHQFVFNEDYVLFVDEGGQVVFAAPLNREPVITLVEA